MSLSTIILGLLMSCALIKTLFGSFILHLSGILLFEQNSGLFGGACAFYNLEVIANTRGEEAVGVFKGNSALYGGVALFTDLLHHGCIRSVAYPNILR